MANTIIIHAPQGCGKNRHAAALAKHYGCDKIVDEFWHGQKPTAGALHLTADDTYAGTRTFRFRDAYARSIHVCRVIPLTEAMREAILPAAFPHILMPNQQGAGLSRPIVPQPTYTRGSQRPSILRRLLNALQQKLEG